MSTPGARHGRQAFWLTSAAVTSSTALIGGAFTLPVYSSSATSATGMHSSESLTLVAVNGLGVLVPVGIPLLISALVWFALHRKCSRGGPFAAYLAWMLVVVLALGCTVAAASIGLLIIPIALLLGCAAAITPSGPAPTQTG